MMLSLRCPPMHPVSLLQMVFTSLYMVGEPPEHSASFHSLVRAGARTLLTGILARVVLGSSAAAVQCADIGQLKAATAAITVLTSLH